LQQSRFIAFCLTRRILIGTICYIRRKIGFNFVKAAGDKTKKTI
jgi:hypothetical protein